VEDLQRLLPSNHEVCSEETGHFAITRGPTPESPDHQRCQKHWGKDIAPYVNGRELTLANGPPLSLSALEQYAETVFSLAADEQLTLMTDGVVEARATGGELLGFDRVKAMTTQSADSIVQAAQDFGQDNDITVMTLRFVPAGVQI
jgi:serine/threonine protein phosphatase PrpC